MKLKFIIFLSFIFVLLGSILAADKLVFAARGSGSTCTTTGTPNDTDYFPFGFLCGSLPGGQGGYTGDLPLNGPDGSSSSYDGTSPSRYYPISGGSTISFNPTIHGKGPARSSPSSGAADVLMWITIDVTNATFGSWQTASGGNTSHECPGVNEPAIFNYQATAGISNIDASPSAYNKSSGQGVEDCGSQGKMIYWQFNNVGSNANLSRAFSIKLNDVTSQFCVRENVSVIYPGDTHLFPTRYPTFDSAGNITSQDNRASLPRVAKQGDRHCYSVRKTNPPPPVRTVGCEQYTNTGLVSSSIYRLSYFPIDQPFVTSGPANGFTTSTASSSYPGSWENFSSAPEYQSGRFNTGSNYSDGVSSYSASTRDLTTSFPAPHGPDRLLYIEWWHHNSNGTWTYNGGQNSHASERDCWAAKCDIIIATPDVKAGDPVTAFMTITNLGRSYLPGSYTRNGTTHYLTVTGTGVVTGPLNVPPQDQFVYINPGGSDTVRYTFTAPSTVGTYSLTGYPDYYGSFALQGTRSGGSTWGGGGNCGNPGTTFSTHKDFTLTPHVNEPQDQAIENPGSRIDYWTTVSSNVPENVNVGVASSFFRQGLGPTYATYPAPTVDVHNPPAEVDVLRGLIGIPADIKAGDQYCANIRLEHTQGRIYPNGIQWFDGPTQIQRCKKIVNKPYFRARGAAVSAGGNFESAGCNNAGSGLLAGWTKNNNAGASSPPYNGVGGAGGQLASIALLKITGYASALGTQVPLNGVAPGAALSFANSGNATTPGQDDSSPYLGGEFNDTGTHCIVNVDVPQSGTGPSGALASWDGAYKVADGYEFLGGMVGRGKNVTLYVDGDLYIGGDVTFQNPTSWNSTNDIPSLIVKAKGNIYISPGVTELSGVYIAQDDGGTKGKIYTCAETTGGAPPFYPEPIGSVFGNCNNRLTVYGSFIANQINFMRTFGSLRNANGLLENGGCSNTGSASSSAQPCPAEDIRFSPEMFLSDPPVTPPDNGATHFDYITSLPPVL